MKYSSIQTNESGRKKRKKPKTPVSQLALDSFEAFKPFINVFDCGGQFQGSPYHLITKEDWDLHHRYKAGERNLTYPDGTKFHPYKHVIRNFFGPEHIDRCFEFHELAYYTSGRYGLALLYLDLDAHHPWQTDQAWARKVLQKLFPEAYFSPSGRGENGFLKVRYTSPAELNDVAGRLQQFLKRLFLHLKILCDIELKGTITDKGKSGKLAKLPFHSLGKHRWNYPELEKFKACPVLNCRRVGHIINKYDPQLSEERIEDWKAQKKLLAEQETEKTSSVQSVAVATDTQSPPAIDVAEKLTVVSSMTKSLPRRKSGSQKTGQAGGDAFSRNLEDLLPFVRHFYKQHRQFPTVQDALQFLQDNELFSGNWNHNEAKREHRVRQILEYVAESFKPEMLGTAKPILLSATKYAWWVDQTFGSGMTAKVTNLKAFDAETLTAPHTRVSVPAKFIATFMAVVDVCLKQDPLSNKAVPTNRIKKIWAMVEGGSRWNQKYFQIVRDRLNRLGVVQIFDKKHESGKAWRWEVGRNYPSADWKKASPQKSVSRVSVQLSKALGIKNEKSGLKIKSEQTILELVSSSSPFFPSEDFKNEQVHNTLYHTDAQDQGLVKRNWTIRPPPD